jgi:hypothetical protein
VAGLARAVWSALVVAGIGSRSSPRPVLGLGARHDGRRVARRCITSPSILIALVQSTLLPKDFVAIDIVTDPRRRRGAGLDRATPRGPPGTGGLPGRVSYEVGRPSCGAMGCSAATTLAMCSSSSRPSSSAPA